MMYAVDPEGRVRLFPRHKEGVPEGQGALVFVGREFSRSDASEIASALNRAVLVGKAEAQSKIRNAMGIVDRMDGFFK